MTAIRSSAGRSRVGVVHWLVALAAFTLLADSAAPGVKSIAGVWRADYRAPGAVVIPYYLELRQTAPGGPVTGRVKMTWGFEPVTASRTTPTGVHLTLGIGSLPLSVEARPERSAWRLTFHDPRTPPFVMTARRIAALPVAPAPPPLPALTTVPPTVRLAGPPMGWNSWNRLNDKVDDRAVREIANAMVTSGLRDAGYRYVVIDDSWAAARGADGVLRGNAKFPDMRALADYVHARGLLLGIYSSPGRTTCGGYAGSLGHEAQDARTFAHWKIDYLKYDWCSAGESYAVADMRAVFQKMGSALTLAGRPVVYSICQYGLGDVNAWARLAGGNIWRTVPDIQPNWSSISRNATLNLAALDAASADAWPDPDMLEVGNGVLSDDENRAHLSLWALSGAPLILGNDPRRMTPAIRAILTNTEVIAVDQAAGAPAVQLHADGDLQIWRKALADGSMVIGVFNMRDSVSQVSADLPGLVVPATAVVRDLWSRQSRRGLPGRITLPAHGVALFRIAP